MIISTNQLFILVGIEHLRRLPRNMTKDGTSREWLHVVWSGLNTAYRMRFDQESRDEIENLTSRGLLNKMLVRGGVSIQLSEQGVEAFLTLVKDKRVTEITGFLSAQFVVQKTAKKAKERKTPKKTNEAIFSLQATLPVFILTSTHTCAGEAAKLWLVGEQSKALAILGY
jgi:hypothetical protein